MTANQLQFTGNGLIRVVSRTAGSQRVYISNAQTIGTLAGEIGSTFSVVAYPGQPWTMWAEHIPDGGGQWTRSLHRFGGTTVNGGVPIQIVEIERGVDAGETPDYQDLVLHVEHSQAVVTPGPEPEPEPEPEPGDFPVVVSVTPTQFGQDATAKAVNVPAVEAGDRLIVLLTTDGNASVSAGGGFTLLDSTANGSEVRHSVYYRDVAAAAGATTVDFPCASPEQGAAQVFRIAAGSFDSTLPPQIGNAALGAGVDPTVPNPPTLSFAWGAEPTLVIAAAGTDRGDQSTNPSYPANYTGGVRTQSSLNPGLVTQHSARRLVSGSPEDPGHFSLPGSNEGWVAQTIAVKGPTAGPQPQPSLPFSGNARIVVHSSSTAVAHRVLVENATTGGVLSVSPGAVLNVVGNGTSLWTIRLQAEQSGAWQDRPLVIGPFLQQPTVLIQFLHATNQDVVVRVEQPIVAPQPGDKTVSGHVRWSNGEPYIGVVQAFDKDLRSEQLLGTAQSDAQGFYSISYVASSYAQAGVGSADVFVRVELSDPNAPGGKRVAGQSAVRFNVPAQITVDLVLGEVPTLALSEYELLEQVLLPILDGAGVHELNNADDVFFLSSETGRDAEHVRLFAIANEHAVALGGPPALAFYGLFRGGLTTELSGLLSQTEERLRAALVQADERRIISISRSGMSLDEIIAALLTGRDSRRADNARPILQGGPLGLPDPLIERLMDLHGGHDGSVPEFWDTLRQDPEFSQPGLVEDIQFAVQAFLLADGNVPLAQFIQAQRPSGASDASALLQLSRDAWIDAITQSLANGGRLPLGVPGDNAQDQIVNYADNLVRTIRGAFVTRAIGAAVQQPSTVQLGLVLPFLELNPGFDFGAPLPPTGSLVFPPPPQGEELEEYQQEVLAALGAMRSELAAFPVSVPGQTVTQYILQQGMGFQNPTRGAVGQFFQNVQDLDLRQVRLGEYLGPPGSPERQVAFAGIAPELQPIVEESVLGYQRLLPIVPTAELAQRFAEEGFRSARDLSRLSARKFTELFHAPLGGDKAARQVLDQARLRSAVSGTLVVQSARAFSDAIANVFGGRGANDKLKDVATWQSLFGSLESHECPDCRSIFGQGAYLVDLLNFVQQSEHPSGTRHPFAELKQRRLDLLLLPLSCDHAETLVSHSQLVTEILEAFIVSDSWPDDAAPWPTDDPSVDDWDAIRTQAYSIVSTGNYPFQVPYSKGREHERIYLERLGLSRSMWLRLFATQSSLSNVEWLGLWEGPDGSFERIFNGNAGSGASRWGLSGGAYPDGLAEVPLMLRQTQLSFIELLQLLDQQYVQRNGALSIDGLEASEIAEMTLSGLGEAHLADIERFLRLWHVLVRLEPRRSLYEVDALISAFGGSSPNLDGLFGSALALMDRLRAQLQVDWLEMLALLQHLDTRRPLALNDDGRLEETPSFYERLFLNPKVVQDEDFFLDASGELQGAGVPLMSKLQVLQAALELSEGDVRLLIAQASLQNAPLNLVNVNLVYARAVLAKALNLDAEQYVALIGLATSDGLAPLDPNSLRFLQVSTRIPVLSSHASTAEALADLGVAATELRFLLKHEPSSGSPFDLSTNALTQRRDALVEIAARIETEGTAIEPDSASDGLRRLLEAQIELVRNAALAGQQPVPHAGYSTGEVAQALLDVVDGKPPSASSPAQLLSTYLPFLPEDHPLTVPSTTPTEGELAARRAYAVRVLVHNRWRSAAVLDMAAALGISPTTTEVVLAEVLVTNHPSKAGEALIDVLALKDLARLGGVEASDVEQAFFSTYRRAAKIARLIQQLELSADDVAHIQQHGQDWSGSSATFDFNLLPLQPEQNDLTRAWFRLSYLARLRKRLPAPPDGLSLLSIFDASRQVGGVGELAPLISDVTGWNAADVATLVSNKNRNLSDFRNADELFLIEAEVRAARVARVSAETLVDWVEQTSDATGAPHVREAVKAQFDAETWAAVSESLDETLLDGQRKALVAFLLGKPEIRQRGIDDINQLYEYLLIDVGLSASWRTTRIREATGSVQLFVQRVLLNLENDVSPASLDSDQWKWMSRYRVWEANRRVFVYPENFLEPELRAGKTDLFRELEAELQQGEVTPQTVEAAYRSYLRKLGEIARLEIVAQTHDLEKGTTHVLGRTANEPRVYYYRRWEAPRWTPWKRVPLEIQSEHVVLHAQGDRLFLFWAEFVQQPDEVPQSQREADAGNRSNRPVWVVVLGHSELRDGKWSPKRVSATETGAAFSAVGVGSVRLFEPDGATSSISVFNDRVYSGDLSAYRLAVEVERDPFETTARGSGAAPDQEGQVVVRLLVDVGLTDDSFGQLREVGNWRRTLPNGEFRATSYSVQPQPRFSVARPWSWKLSEQDWRVSNGLDLPMETPALASDARTMQVIVVHNTGLPVRILETAENAATLFRPTLIEPVLLVDGPPLFFFDLERAYHVTLQEEEVLVWRGIDAFVPRSAQMLFEAEHVAIPWLAERVRIDRVPDTTGRTFSSAFLGQFESFGNGGFSVQLPRSRVIFRPHYHPHVEPLEAILNRQGTNGVSSLLNVSNQLDWDDSGGHFSKLYGPRREYVSDLPKENFDFSLEGAYSDYNWELFFHVPMLIAGRLTAAGRFDEARRWYHYVFDPTTDEAGGTDTERRLRFWHFAPFRQLTETKRIEDLLEALDGNDNATRREFVAAVQDWLAHPFDPHRIARMRIGAYERWVFMKYMDNVLAEADRLFAQDTRESIGEATQLYVLVSNMLGPRSETIPDPSPATSLTYEQLVGDISVPDSRLRVEDFVAVIALARGGSQPRGSSDPAALMALFLADYFCIPGNPKLKGYWDTVDDRLFKIRHGLDINGVGRSLALTSPPIDPLVLVRAVAGGLDVASAVSDLASPASHYRFTFLMPKAQELVSEVRSFGAALLAALEKKDAEELGNLRTRHESGLLALVRRVREKQLEEAEKVLDGLQKTRTVTLFRRDHYRNLERVNARESAHLDLLDLALGFQVGSQFADLLASVAHAIPNFTAGAAGIASPVATAEYGGTYIANAAQAAGRVLQLLATISSHQASRVNVIAGWDRREEEWDFQADTAEKELAQVDEQIEAQRLRIEMARQELANHERQQKNAEQIEAFLSDKFTSQELYGFMSGELARLYFEAYQLAYRFAKQTERAYRFERAITSSDFVAFGSWDSQRKGLLAGERLALDLRRLEIAYLDQNVREFELTKNVSLLQLDAMALLALRTTGSCNIDLPEALFDLDYPGHYMRRIKSMSVSIPCVTGPNEGVHATLRLNSSRIRVDPTVGGGYPPNNPDPRFLVNFTASQAIATSSGQGDTGLFELSLGDARLLPFEGAGAVSNWTLTMPRETNAIDFDTIADVVLRVAYTARDGGEPLRSAAAENAQLPERVLGQGTVQIPLAAQPNLARLFSARHEFSTSWQAFQQGLGGGQSLSFEIGSPRFPLRYRDREISVKKWTIVLMDFGAQAATATATLAAVPSNASPVQLTFSVSPTLGGLPTAVVDLDSGPLQDPPQTWTLTFDTPLVFSSSADVVLVCHYEVPEGQA